MIANTTAQTRYRAERLRELESRHARRCGKTSPQIHQPTSAIHEGRLRGSGRADGNQEKCEEDESCASDDINDEAQQSRQRRAIEAALSAAVGATASYVAEPRRLHAAVEDERSSCDERVIERREEPQRGRRTSPQGSEADTGEAEDTWYGRDYCGRDHGSPAQPLGKPPLAPSRAVPSRNLSSKGKSEVTDGRSGVADGENPATDEDGGTIQRYIGDVEDDADEVQTETTSAHGIENAGNSWGDQEQEDDGDRNNSVWEENISSRGWSWEDGSAARGGGVPSLAEETDTGTGAAVNPGESCRGRLDCSQRRYDNSSGRLEGFNCHGRDGRDVGLLGGPMHGSGLQAGVVPSGKMRQCTESESSSSVMEPSTYALASPVVAMGEGVAGADRPVARGPRDKTRVCGGNVGGIRNVVRHNLKPGQTPTSTMVETDHSIGRGGHHGGEKGTPADDPHRRGGRREDGLYTKSGTVARAVFPPDSEATGRSTEGQAGGESRAPAADNHHRLGGEGGKARDSGSATGGRAGNTHTGGEKREGENEHSRSEEVLDDDDGSDTDRWNRSGKHAAQDQGALRPETSVVVRCNGSVTADVLEYQDDFFMEGSARQGQGTDISFAVSSPRCSQLLIMSRYFLE